MKFMHLVVLALFAASAAFAENVDLSKLTNNYQAKEGDVLTGMLGGNYMITIANNATVTLKDVTINGVNKSSYEWAGITCLGNCTIVLEGKNTVKGFYWNYPGILVEKNYTLTIDGDGSLDASSNGYGAGIGGAYNVADCGNIVIRDGEITATGGYDAAGIGSAYKRACGTITISGGEITAKGGEKAAGIGSGYKGTCGDITITNEVTKVVAKKGEGAPHSIGKGAEASVGTVSIGGKVGAIERGYYSFPVYDLSDLKADFEAQNDDVLTGTLDGENQPYKITIADGATVTLKDASIKGVNKSSYQWAGITCLGNCTIVLEGKNTVKGFYENYPGIQAAKNYTLTIDGDGSLEASSNGAGAGIGGGYYVDCGNIVISGGEITATGGWAAAGIGTGHSGTCVNITISGGEITATGGNEAAGIGTGHSGTCVNITISGGEITATGGNDAAGIGSGYNGTCGDITITNEVTKVVARRGKYAPHSIGKGYGTASVGTVTIGGVEGAIERGYYSFPVYDLSDLKANFEAQEGDVLTGTLNGEKQPYKITIANNATVTLKDVTINGVNNSSYQWAGITCLGNCTVVLEGKNIVKGFYQDYPGIQAAKRDGDGEEYTLTIKGEGSLDANSNGRGAGIGSSREGTCGNITISGGEITATGGEKAAGIGSGLYGKCGDITITNEVTKVVAKKGKDAPHSIGKGYGDEENPSSVGTVTIGGKVGAIETSPFKFPMVPVDLAQLAGDYEVMDVDTLTGALGGNYKITIANNATVTLKDVTINGVNKSSYKWAGITCLGNCTIVLEGKNTVKGFYEKYPGIQAAKNKGEGEEYTLTIKGEGSLEASSNGRGAGIGGANGVDCGNIVISGGEITATGGEDAAGIGGGWYLDCGNITISGGNVTATGGEKAAGIGCGYYGKCGNITITDEVTKVVAIKGKDAPYSIGKGVGSASVGTVTIGGKVGAIERGYYSFPVYDLSDLKANFEAQEGDVLTGTLNGEKQPYKITIANNATVTLKDVTINGVNNSSYNWAGITCLGNCTIVLEGKNSVKGFYEGYPGIRAAKRDGDGEEYTLTIQGDGSLDASSNGYAAGIGGAYSISCGNITINDGEITATGGRYAAGIGSGHAGSCGDITISGGNVTATGGPWAAGIGGGSYGKCGDITITNEVTKVVAIKGYGAPHSIGKGNGDEEHPSSVGTVTIGGKVGAIERGYYSFPVYDLSDLKADFEAQEGDVLTGTLDGENQPYKITIANNATVTLKDAAINGVHNSSYKWAGITCLGNCTIVLEGKNTVKGFNEDYPGIQAAKRDGEGEEYTLTIDGDGSLDASSNGYGAGIGGGYKVDCGNITINGGKITATGGEDAAGIGCGNKGTCGNITISGGNVSATGGRDAAGIGGGVEGTCGNITITNEVTKVVAIKGNGAPHSIGKGYGTMSSVGTVTIGGVEGAIEKSPFKFPMVPVDLAQLAGDYEAIDGDTLTGTLGGYYKITIADGATVTLKDAAINGVNNSSYKWAGITCLGNCTIVLEGKNTVKGFYEDYPGIQAAKRDGEGEEYTLTIEGEGSLEASSNGDGAGIGGGFDVDCGNITISGGEITATGGSTAAGIGGGFEGTCGNITITNEVAKVVAIKGEYAPYSIGKGYGNASVGTVTIGGVEGAIEKSPFKFPMVPVNLAQLAGDYEAMDGDTLTGKLGGNYKITIADGATVTLKDVTINGVNNSSYDWAGITCLGNCTIVLEGKNTVKGFYQNYPGIQAAKNYTLTIEGEGSLEASSNGYGAGIGGGYTVDCGNIVISGGEMTATGGEDAAGIGSGYYGTCGNITISGGNVSATGGYGAAGIGSGHYGSCDNITITNEVTKVVAIKGDGAPHSIGKGYGDQNYPSFVGTVTIGGVEGAIEKEIYVFPAPTTIVDIESVGGKTVAVINGDYSGNDALNIEKDTTVDRVAFNRIFPIIKNSSNYSTIMFPFDIAAKEVGNIKQVVSFLGIGVDSESQMYYVAVARVWCDDQSKDGCDNEAMLKAYKPYLIQLKDEETSISINNTEPLVLKQTPAAEDLDVEQHPNYSQYGNYVFRGVLQGKTWEADSPEVLGTGGVAAYGFASKVTAQYSVGQFVRVDGGAYIKPFRAYIYKAGVKSIKANGDYVLRHTASINDGVQETMDIVIVDGKNGEEHTTVIGTFNSRTGEIRLNHTQRTYDLKGRSVRDAKHRAKGVYLKK